MTEKVKKELKKWVKDKFITDLVAASGGTMTDEIDEYLELAVSSIENTRVMYDFYDNYGIYLCMGFTKPYFVPTVRIKDTHYKVIDTSTRAEAEKEGFKKCEELLNEFLCKQK